jgi:4-diphosphocytidyl-2-C-methyl-D-erythritol kinase
MLSFPNAKINLGLRILSKRKDGYHEVDTCMYPINWCDALEIMEHKKLDFSNTGLIVPGKFESNLVVRAFKRIQKDFSLNNIKIHLHKTIPFGAGLGGGSSDAAYMLKMVSEKFELYLDESILEDYAAELGSDCAFFIQNRPVIASGRGEILEPIDNVLQGKHIVVVFPGFQINTAQGYSGVKPDDSGLDVRSILSKEPMHWKSELENHFERTLFPKYPLLQEIKEQFYNAGALYASLSGSGSAMYGIFENEDYQISFPEDFQVWKGKAN